MAGVSERVFFFDTYAFFEVIRGNPKYDPYIDAVAVTTVFNLAELNYGLKKNGDARETDAITARYWPSVVEVTLEDVQAAMSLLLKQKDMSIPDVIGYTVAKRLGIRFLTGDDDFRDMPNVEFVKK